MATEAVNVKSIVGKLSLLDRFLPLWIFAAMALGIGLGKAFPGIGPALDTVKVADVSLPIAIGLLAMMYPVLAKVRYETLGTFKVKGKLFGASIVFNWVLGPAVMFTLAWVMLPDLPEYRTGLVMIGLALEQLNILPKLGLRPPSLPFAKLLANPRPWASFPVGLALGLMPCGMLYAVVAYAAATGSPVKGALVMALFWLGNLIPLVAFGLASQLAWGRLRGHAAKLAAIAILVLGVHTIVDRGMAVAVAANAQQDPAFCHPSEVHHDPAKHP